jgi:NDP-sugar pyrophosphorylase family protein
MGGSRAGRAAAVIGFCLAAGAGTRLTPLTRVIPKPLLAPAGRPLVDLAVEALKVAGATRVVVNAHHGANMLVAQLAGRAGVEVVVEPVLLGTGGGLVNAARLGLLGDGDDAVLVTAADHVVDPADLVALVAVLERSGAPMVAGLVPASTDAFALRLEEPAAGSPKGLWTATAPPSPGRRGSPAGGPAAAGWGSRMPAGRDCHEPAGSGSRDPARRGPRAPAGEPVGMRWAAGGGWVVHDPEGPWDSAGAYALRAGLLRNLEPGPATLVDRVLGPLLERGRLAGLPFRGPMADAGTLARLLEVSAGLLAGQWPYELPPGRMRRGVGTGPVFVGEGAEVDPAAVLAGPVVLNAGCRVGAGAVATRSVIGPGAVVGPGARVTGSFLGPRAQVPSGGIATAALVPGAPSDPGPAAAPHPDPPLPGPPVGERSPTASR